MNLDYVAPFANTSDLKRFTPKIDVNLAKIKEQERIYKQRRGLAVDEDDGVEEAQTIVMEEQRQENENGEGGISQKTGQTKSQEDE